MITLIFGNICGPFQIIELFYVFIVMVLPVRSFYLILTSSDLSKWRRCWWENGGSLHHTLVSYYYRTTHPELASTVWRPWIKNLPMSFSRASAVGSQEKAKVASISCSVLYSGKCQSNTRSEIRCFGVALFIPCNACFTQNITELAEPFPSSGRFGLSFPHEVAAILSVMKVFLMIPAGEPAFCDGLLRKPRQFAENKVAS